MNCFPVKYKWLIYEENLPMSLSTALQLLSESNIHVDAEISYLNLNKSVNRFVNLYLEFKKIDFKVPSKKPLNFVAKNMKCTMFITMDSSLVEN